MQRDDTGISRGETSGWSLVCCRGKKNVVVVGAEVSSASEAVRILVLVGARRWDMQVGGTQRGAHLIEMGPVVMSARGWAKRWWRLLAITDGFSC